MTLGNEMPLHIYVAGPFSADTPEERAENTRIASEVGIQLAKKGHLVHVPHQATAFMDGVMEYEYFMSLDLSIIALWADALFYVGPSPGADRERALAETLEMEVYERIEDVPDFEGDVISAP